MERRLQPGAGRARRSARHHPSNGADRDHPRRFRDGGDSLRATRSFERTERGTLGLHLQHHQKVPQPTRVCTAGPRTGDHDRAVHARLHRAPRQDVSQARGARDGGDGRVHSFTSRPGGEPPRLDAGQRRQGSRGERRLRRNMGRPSRPGADRDGVFRPGARRPAEPARAAEAGGVGDRGSADRCEGAGRDDH